MSTEPTVGAGHISSDEPVGYIPSSFLLCGQCGATGPDVGLNPAGEVASFLSGNAS